MFDWPIGISTGCFYHRSIFDCLESIRSAGFLTIEICSSPSHLNYADKETVRQALEMIRRLDIEPYSFHAPFSQEIDISSLNDKQRENATLEILKAAEAAAILGVRHFVIHPGPEKSLRIDSSERFQRMENALSVLNRVSGRCRDFGIELILENMLPHLFLGHTRDILWMVGGMAETNIGVCLDTGHANLSGDLYSAPFRFSGHLKMLHLNDNTGKGDEHLPPGKGHIQWDRLAAALYEAGFSGTLILELAGESNRSAESILANAREARIQVNAVFRSVMRRLGLEPEGKKM